MSGMVKLGDKVTDSLTGFTGIAYTRVECLTGCIQIGVIPKATDNVMPAIIYVDEDRLIASVRDLQCMKEGVLSPRIEIE